MHGAERRGDGEVVIGARMGYVKKYVVYYTMDAAQKKEEVVVMCNTKILRYKNSEYHAIVTW